MIHVQQNPFMPSVAPAPLDFAPLRVATPVMSGTRARSRGTHLRETAPRLRGAVRRYARGERGNMDRKLLFFAALALAACTPDFDPASKVDRLRVLAIRADPPEIEPPPAAGPAAAPDRAALTSFVLRGDSTSDPGHRTTVLYLACTPAPGDPTSSPCAAYAGLRDPSALVAEAMRAGCGASGGGSPAAIGFAGIEVCQAGACGPATVSVGGAPVALPPPELAIPPGYGFDGLPPGSPERILGVQAQVVAFALDATPEELAAGPGSGCPYADIGERMAQLWPAREHVLATKTVRIRGPEALDPPNRNPAVDGIAAGGTPLASGSPVSSLSAGTWQLRPVLSPEAVALQETYTRLDAAGTPVERAPEEWVYSWFATAGEIHDLHTREPKPDDWKVREGDAGASGARALVAAVVRDLRGGTAWVLREVVVGP